ncbi:MAG: MBL fold metallo-hydrolase [Rhodothermales bacterium]
MPTLHLLGTGAALSDPHRTTTMLAFAEPGSTLVVDCGGDVVQRLLAAGIDLATISALLLTHEHIDHVGGFPLFMERIWLAGRQAPIPVYGIKPALDQARRCFASFDTSRWEGLPDIEWHPFPETPNARVLDDDEWRVTAAPGSHSVPVVGLRVESKATGGVVAYSCDTEPSPVIAALAFEADILVHEATGTYKGHSSPAQAAAVAAQAKARRLLLVHLPPGLTDDDLHEARDTFAPTALGVELGAYAF